MSRPEETPAEEVAAGQPADVAEDFAVAAGHLRGELDRVLGEDLAAAVPDRAVHDLMIAATKLFVAKREAGQGVMPFEEPDLTATEVMVTTGSMLKAANLEVFELTMWGGLSTP